MNIVRLMVSFLIATFTIAGLREHVIKPYDCNQLLKLAKRNTAAAVRSPQPAAARLAGRNLDLLAPCGRWCAGSVDALMVLAANERLVGRQRVALTLYHRASDLDRRPEILFNRGMTQYEAGNRDASVDAIVEAVEFNYTMLREVTDPSLQKEIRERVLAAPPSPR